MIGDSDIDVTAGRNAGCRTVLLVKDGQARSGSADVVAASLVQAVHGILHWEMGVDQGT